MPKSKRAKIVHLTRTKKKGVEMKQSLIQGIRDALDSYKNVFVFSFHNLRSNHFKQIRHDWSDSRFFLGKNKVMKVALGKAPEDEYKEETYRIAKALSGNTGILMTNRPADEVKSYFAKIVINDFPRAGFKVDQTITVPAGPLTQFIPSMNEHLRGLGMPVQVKNAVVTLLTDHKICRAGDTLTPEQAKQLEHFGHQLAQFRVDLVAHWCDGHFERLSGEEDPAMM